MKILLVTEHSADDRKSLAALRALTKSGAKASVASDVSNSSPLRSRYCHSRVRCPDPLADWTAFSAWIREQVLAGQYDVVLPLSDYPTMALVEQRDLLQAKMAVPVPSGKSCGIAHDKLKLIRLAAGLGIDVPETWCPESRDEVKQIGRQVSFPCVLKLRKGAGGIGLSFPQSAAGLLDTYDQLDIRSDSVFTSDRPLIQEYIPGLVHDACLLFRYGEARAALSQKRLAMYPQTGGVGIHNETTSEPELIEKARLLLSSLDWHGPAMVEFKHDRRDGKFKLMEINSRYWGTLDLAIQAGVNFPWLACRMALDGDIDPVFTYRVGLKYRWNWTYGWQYVMQSEQRMQALWEFYKPAADTCSEFWPADPMPHLLNWRH
ncbi:MAG: ATP-grasp domain-containing protein [Lysobacterales bacterium]